MIRFLIKKKKTMFNKQKFYCQIKHSNGNILFWSEKQSNLDDLEDMIDCLKRDLPKAEIIYDFTEQ